MLRLLIFLVGMLTTSRPAAAVAAAGDPAGGPAPSHAEGPDDGDTWPRLQPPPRRRSGRTVSRPRCRPDRGAATAAAYPA